MASPRLSAAVRIQRLLAILQWTAPAGTDGVGIDELCQRFAMAPAELVRELEMAAMINADAVEYDEMPFEVYVEDGRVFVSLFSFNRPLRLSPAEGLALVAAADALVGEAKGDDSPLWRALTKLAALLGIEPGEAVDVELDPGGGEVGRMLTDAVGRRRRVRFRYWTYGRDVVGERTVEPWQVFAVEGAWYLAGLDLGAGSDRRFRLDRIEAVELLDEAAAPAPTDLDPMVRIDDRAPQVVLDLPAEARWVAESFPVLEVVPRPDGRLVVTLAVTGASWLDRLLLRLGPDAHVVRLDPALGEGDVLARAARRVLERYHRGGAPPASR